MPDSPLSTRQLKRWLGEAGFDYYLCEHCHGLHLTHIQSLEGVVESRLFKEDWGLIVSTEFQVRPTAILPLSGELGSFNSRYPILKLFLDIVDDAMPQLVAGATVLTGEGLTQAQFTLFVTSVQDMLFQLSAELNQADFLLTDMADSPPEGQQVH